MELIDALKKVVADYMQNENLSNLVYGTWGGSSVKIDNKPLSVPLDMVDVPVGTTVTIGKRVSLIQQHGGQRYALIGVLN